MSLDICTNKRISSMETAAYNRYRSAGTRQ